MDDQEKNQKTIVAFIAGLLIGGLLVWVFGSAPSSAPEGDRGDTNTNTTENIEAGTEAGTGDANANEENTAGEDTTRRVVVTGEGSISVLNQAAGEVVAIDAINYPTTDGWIVVHEDLNGELGNALGASRYSTENGLMPQQVELLRMTTSGATYHAVLYSENGDRVFDLNDDAPITATGGAMIEATFSVN